MDDESNASSSGKMRIDALVSAQSISPTAPKSASWLATNGGNGEQHQIRSLHMLLIEAKRAALEDAFIEKRKEQQVRATTGPLDQPQLRPALATISSLPNPIPIPPSSPSSTKTTSSTSGVLNKRIFSRGLHIGAASSSVENLSFSVLNRTNGLASKTLRLPLSATAAEASKENIDVNRPADVEMKKITSTPPSSTLQQQPQPKLLKLTLGAGLPQQRRPLSNLPTLTRTHSFPPATSSPSTPSRSTTLNVRKRSLEASPSTAASARILVQSLPNVKIHVQKKIKLMPRPAGQVQARPEGVKNVLVYHF
jgi:hypothetical protein